jgi:hypothetical protein
MTTTPLDRLKQMLATDPHAAEAERLLRHLVVFQGLFPRDAIVKLAPDEMSREQRVEAFATLCQWRIVRKKSQRRYQIDESIKALYPPTRDVLIRYVEYWERCLITTDDMVVYLYWTDVTCAMVWGLQHWPEKIEAITIIVPQKIMYLRDEWQPLLDRLKQFIQSGNLSASFPPTASREAMATWQDQILEHYIAMAQPGTRLMRMSRRAEAAHINQNLSLARQYYEQAAQYAISWATTSPAWVRMMTLQGLVEVLILQKDIAALYTYVGQFLPLIQGNSYTLHKLGRIMMRIGDRAAARHYFACALDLNDGEFHTHHGNSLLYRDWAQVEKSEGHYQKTDALYQLAIIEALYAVEHALGWDSPRWNEEGWELVEHLKREWSALAAQYIDLIPPDKPSQPS